MVSNALYVLSQKHSNSFMGTFYITAFILEGFVIYFLLLVLNLFFRILPKTFRSMLMKNVSTYLFILNIGFVLCYKPS